MLLSLEITSPFTSPISCVRASLFSLFTKAHPLYYLIMVHLYRTLLTALLLVISSLGFANEAITPTITPSFFTHNQLITITYDVTGTTLASLSEAYAWVWIPNTSINARWNVNPASSDVSKSNNAKFTKSIVAGRTLFKLTFTPSTFFDADISTQSKMGILLKGNDWPLGQTTDYLVNFWDGNFDLRLTSPSQAQLFVSTLDEILITAETPLAASFALYVNEVLVNEQQGLTTYSYTYTVSETAGTTNVRLVGSTQTATDEVSFQFILASNSETLTRPAGILPGINYGATDASKATLCLLAPGKSSVYVLGDFTDWNISSDYLMKRDGEYFWLELTGLTPGTEYGFQYLVDQSIRVADPYADKILDPDDQYIADFTYPGLKDYPAKALSANWYENRVAVLQTGQTPYMWQTSTFEKPAKENLIVYEILLRDLFDANNRNYQALIDTLSYLKRLGINAIELMPIMEFNGNEGWGYNPTFMFAPDKYYGTKNKLKELVDKCHQQGIAVILDIAMNHQDVPNTYAAMYFDYAQFVPKDNPFFNTTPKHPFNVFFDMNHESAYTKDYLDTVNYYWLNEYKVDGFRFDLSKGFTQKNSGNDVGGWSAYDASRIALLKRMADKIWEHTPDAYVILEHLGVNEEERELAEYRAGEGKGMMLWGKMTEQYNQNSMGYSSNSTISGVYHKSKSWSVPHLVSYMESHDEERLMFKNKEFGNSSVDYSAKDENTALHRMEATFATFLTIPGPKMMWQFGELGYDYSINRCTDGTIKEDCRLSSKPVVWDYLEDPDRYKLFERVADLLRLRNQYSVFSTGDVTFSENVSSVKAITIKNKPYTSSPTSTAEMNVQIVANFDIIKRTFEVTFPHAGTWYDYAHGGMPYVVPQTNHTVTLSAGGYFLFTDVPIEITIVTAIENEQEEKTHVYPNPTRGLINLDEGIENETIVDLTGKPVMFERVSKQQLFIQAPSGIYLLKGTIGAKSFVQKVIVY